MAKRLIQFLSAASLLLLPATAQADKAKNVLDLKHQITDSNIIFPESYETDSQKMRESWYLKNYTATDDRYLRQGDVAVTDDVLRDRLAKLNTVIDMPFNPIVRSYIERYTDRGRASVANLLGLGIYYMPIFEQALEEAGLPLELKYLPVIESALNPNAVSKSGAAGLWQFMLIAAKGLDLEVNSLVDERRDPYLSSKKAAKLLGDLYSTYGDWTLAIAAYNCGPGTLNKAIRRAGGDPKSHDFWSLYYYLPAETRGYVPMFIAANYVMNYYPYHNISPVLATKPLVTDTLMISDRVHFNQISSVLDIPVDELRVLNPQFRADIIPGTSDHPYTLVLPSQQVHAYIVSENDILAYEAEKYARRTDAQPGENPNDNASANQPAANEADDEPALADNAPFEPAVRTEQPIRKPATNQTVKAYTHKVEPGQTLYSIAEMYQVSVDDLKQWNSLTRSSVRTGQMLRVNTTPELADANGARNAAPAKKENPQASNKKPENNNTANTTADNRPAKKNAKADTSKKKKTEPKKPASHTVKEGESLSRIAKQHGVTVEELKKANNLKGNELIHPGDNIKLPSKNTKASGTKKSGSKSTGSKKTGKKSSKKRR